MTKIIGLTGGIGSGKTTVANHFMKANIPVYIADDPLTCVAKGGGMVLEMMEKKGISSFSLE